MTSVAPAQLALVELVEAHLDAVADIEAVSSSAPWSRSLFLGELSMSPSERHWLVGVIGDRVVGFGGVMLVNDEAHLMNLAVGLEHRRAGIARRILRQLILDIVEAGVRHITLEVRTDNVAAIQLYEAFRFVGAGERKDYYGAGRHALIMWANDIDRPDYLTGLDRGHELGETS